MWGLSVAGHMGYRVQKLAGPRTNAFDCYITHMASYYINSDHEFHVFEVHSCLITGLPQQTCLLDVPFGVAKAGHNTILQG